MNYGNNSEVAASFAFKLQDPDFVQSFVKSQNTRTSTWKSDVIRETAMLQAEAVRHSDVIFVPMVDSYDQLPKKLTRSYDFDFLLKVDDDSVVNLPTLEGRLDKLEHQRKVWWGRFRYNWPLNIAGKWVDVKYSSPVYPRFACGAGYVLSRDLVTWLVDNREHLEIYQGEDTSMGIWLAAIGAHAYDDIMFSCDAQRNPATVVSTNHKIDEIRDNGQR